MTMWNDDDRKWLFDQMRKKGVNTGSYEDFTKSLANKEDRDWYYEKSRGIGLNVGSADDFARMMVQPTEKPVQQANTPTSVPSTRTQVNPTPAKKKQSKQRGWKPTPVQMMGIQMQMDNLSNSLQQMRRDTNTRLKNIRKGNTLGRSSEKKFNPTTGKMATKYYTTYGDEVNTPSEQSRLNLQYRDEWEATTPEGRKHREQRIQNDFDERVGAVMDKYDPDNAAELAWQNAETQTKADQEKHNNAIWNSYAGMGGGREMRIMSTAETHHSNLVDRLKHHDLQKMADNAWNMLGKEKQQAITEDLASALRSRYPKATEEQISRAAADMARQQSDQRVFKLAVAKNAPRSATEYFFRKAIGMNSLMKIHEALARSEAGTTGDWEAREVAEQQYNKGIGRKTAGVAGTVAGFVFDPLVLLSAGAGSTAVKGGMWLGGKAVGQAATRQFASTLGGRLATGIVGGAANLGTFEAGSEAVDQARWGGHRDERTGEVGDYSPAAVAKQFGHGMMMGAATGMVSPLIGNVSDKLVRATASTFGKAAVRAGEIGVGTVAEGTIFSVPEWIEGDRNAMDVWTDNMAMMAGFRLQRGIKSAPRVIAELSSNPRNKAGFETRLRSVLDNKRPDLALTEDEKRELDRSGYSDLKKLTEDFKQFNETQAKMEKQRPGTVDAGRMIEAGKDTSVPYNRFAELMNDGSVSEAARAKMYYYLTGRMLPMSTVMGSSVVENKDADGNVRDYTVQSVGANGVVTSRTFGDRKRAEVELSRINRQSELNGIDVGERFFDWKGDNRRMWEACQSVAEETGAPANHLFELMKDKTDQMNEVERGWAKKIMSAYDGLGEQYGSSEVRANLNKELGVDVDQAIKKEPNRRSEQEQKALGEYAKRLFADVKTKQDDAAKSAEPTAPNAPTGETKAAGLPVMDGEALTDPISEARQRGYDANADERKDIVIESSDKSNAEAQEAWNGVVERINEDADYLAAQERERARQTQHTDGSFHLATLKEKDADGHDRQVYIVDGKVQMMTDGTMVDREASDNVVVVVNPVTGERRQIDPSADTGILSVDKITTADEHEANIERSRQTYVQTQLDDAQGTVRLAPGHRIVLPSGEEALVTATDGDDITVSLADGRQATVQLSELQRIRDEKALADYNQRHGITGEPSEAQAQQTPQTEQVQGGVVSGTPEDFAPDMELTIRDEDGTEKPAMVMERVRYENGKFIPDAQGNIIEYYMDGEVRHENENKLRGRIESYVPAEAQQETAPEEAEEQQPQSMQEGIPNENEDTEVQNENEVNLPQSGNIQQNSIESEVNSPQHQQTAAPETYATSKEVETPVDNQVAEPMPMREDGEEDWQATTPERAHRYIFSEAGLSRSEGNHFVSANIDAANKALVKAKSAQMPQVGTSIKRYNEAKAKRQEKIDEAQRTLDYWNGVRVIQNAIQREENERRAAEDAARHDEAVAQAQAEVEARKQADAERKAVGNGNPMPAITEKWNEARKIDGHKDEIVLPDGTSLKGHYVLHESGASSPSHDPQDWQKTDGFPMDANGGSVNDRDYERDRDAQEHTQSIARQYDQRALQSVPVVSGDGVVLSGNGRTMAGELAARDNTDGAYLNYLKEYAHKWGFTPEQVKSMQHPRVSFVPDEGMPYTAATFARFNQQEMKSQNKTEQAVKLGKTVSDDNFRSIVRSINAYDTLGDFYNDPKASLGAVYDLRSAGVVPQAQLAEMVDGVRGQEKLSAVGREFLENMLIGKAFDSNPDVVRMLTAEPAMRQTVITALGEIADNIALGDGWSLQNAMADAVKLCFDARQSGAKYGDIVSTYARQGELFADPDRLQTVADFNNATMLMLADVLNDKRVTLLKTTLQLYNNDARQSAAGQGDLFTGGIKSREDILQHVINYINDNYGKRKELEAARAAAMERRKAESIQEDGIDGESRTRNEKAYTEVPSNDGRGDDGSLAGRQSGNLEEANNLTYQLSDEVDENGQQFVLNSNGDIAFGFIREETGLTPAPILLSEGVITNPQTGAGYGLLHIEARHGKQIRDAGYASILEFIEEVAENYNTIRKGNERNGLQTYMLQLTDKHNNTLLVELSGDGTYWNINTAGIFKTSYGANRTIVYNRHTTDNQSAETDEASLSGEQSGTTPSTRMNTPTQSDKSLSIGKDSKISDTKQGKEEKSVENDGVKPLSSKIEDAGRSERGEETPQISHDEAISLIAEMENRAEVAPEVELTIENWDKLFADGKVNTPLGEVKMGENQFAKLMRKGREGKLGMIRPTLEHPDVVVEELSEAKGGNTTERGSSYVFVKAFKKSDGSRYYYFTSVTVSKDGKEVVISNQEKSRNRLLQLLTKGDVLWRTPKDATAFSAERQGLDYVQPLEAETATKGSGITPQRTSSTGKNRKISDTKQEKKEKVVENNGAKPLSSNIESASAEVNISPTEAQKEVGNYKKGHVQVGTFDISIEQPQGSIRKGTDANGKTWENKMHNTYGYIRGTVGVDGDHIDVFLSNDIDGWDGRKVYVVDQYNPDGSFDEHKVMLGFNDLDEAKSDYLANYEKGWENGRRIDVSASNLEDFEKWIDSSRRKTKPFSEYSSVNKETVAKVEPQRATNKTPAELNGKPTASNSKDKANLVEKQRKQKTLDEVSKAIDEFDKTGKLWLEGDKEQDAERWTAYQTAKAHLLSLLDDMTTEQLHSLQDDPNVKFAVQDVLNRYLQERETQERLSRGFYIHLNEQDERRPIQNIEKKERDIKPYDFVKIDNEASTSLSGVYHDNGYVIGSDGHILFAKKEDYPKAIEGKVTDKKGNVVVGKYPDWKKTFSSAIVPVGVEASQLRLFANGVEAYAKEQGMKKKNVSELKVSFMDASGKARAYNLQNLQKFLRAAKDLGAEKLTETNEGFLCAKNNSGIALCTSAYIEDFNDDVFIFEPVKVPVMTEDEYLASKGLSSPMSDFMLDKTRIPNGETASQKAKREQAAEKAINDYATQKENARREFREKLAKGELREPTLEEKKQKDIDRLLATAHGDENKESTQAARRALAKRGIGWKAERQQTDRTLKNNTNAKQFATNSKLNTAPSDKIDKQVNDKLAEEKQSIVERAKLNGTYMKAPNGKPSNLNEKQWVQVRTKAFKDWFGDWEKTARIEKLKQSKPVEITGEEYKGKYELNRESAKAWIKDNLRGEYVIADTGEKVFIGRKGINKVTSHSMGSEPHLKSLIVIPKMLNHAIFISEEMAEKSRAIYPVYRYYILGLKIGDVDYTAKLTIGVDENGNKYYDHSLTEIEKGKLLDRINSQAAINGFISTGAEPDPSVTIGKDTKLVSILQVNSSKVLDDNGEPMVVYHGTLAKGLHKFNKDFIGSRYSYDDKGFFFINKKNIAEDYATSEFDASRKGEIIPAYLSLKNPLIVDSEWCKRNGLGSRVLKEQDVIEFWDNYQTLMIEESEKNDGVIITDGSTTMAVAFEPNQIKSAEANNGEFSKDVDDIRYRENTRNGNKNTDQSLHRDIASFKDGEMLRVDGQLDGFRMKGLNSDYKSLVGMLDAFRNKYPEYVATFVDKNGEPTTPTSVSISLVYGLWEQAQAQQGKFYVKVEPWSKYLNKKGNVSLHTKQETDAYRKRSLRRAQMALDHWAEKLNIGNNVKVLMTSDGLTGKKAIAKGWFDPKTDKITVVLANHQNVSDLIVTLMHEGVAHYGLRKLFGKHFDTFLDNVYNNTGDDVKARIDEMKKDYNGDTQKATEEYLAGLAEDTNYEHADKQGWWSKIKDFFLNMLAKVGIRLKKQLTDNELRYVLWRSYMNLSEPGRRATPAGSVVDDGMQEVLKVGNYSEDVAVRHDAKRAAEGDTMYRIDTGHSRNQSQAEQIVKVDDKVNEQVIRRHVEKLGEKLNTSINIIEDVSAITHPSKAIQERIRRSKGWYNVSTGEVNIVLENNRDVEDVTASVMHEVIAHKGLRELVGEEHYNDFLDETYKHLRDELKQGVDDAAGRAFMDDVTKNGEKAGSYEQHRRRAVDELFGRMAEKPFEVFSTGERTLWQKMCHIIRKLLDRFLGSLKLPRWFTIGDNEIRYMLWRSKERLERGKESPIDFARDMVKREELGLTDEARYRDGDSTDPVRSYVDGIRQRHHLHGGAIHVAISSSKDMERLRNVIDDMDYSAVSEEYANPITKGIHLPDNHIVVVFTDKLHSEEEGEEVWTHEQTHEYFEMLPAEKQKLFGEECLAYLGSHNQEVYNKITELYDKEDWHTEACAYLISETIKKYGLDKFIASKFVDNDIIATFATDFKNYIINGKEEETERYQFWREGNVDGRDEELGLGGRHHQEGNEQSSEETKTGRRRSRQISGETDDIWNDRSMGMQERITAAATRLSSNHIDDKRLRNDAMRAIGGNLADLRKAMSLQRRFDMTTVKRVSDLARILMKGGYLDGLTKYEVTRLLAAVKNSVGHHNIEGDVQKVMDIMIDNQLRNAENALHSLERIKGSKVDARGVEVQGQLDPTGTHVMAVFKKTRGWERTDIEEAIADTQQRMGSNDASVADEAALDYTGLQLALDYAENIKNSKTDERKLRDEIKQSHDEAGARNRLTDAYQQYISILQEAIRENKVERAQAYYNLVARISGSLRESIANAKAYKEAEKQRIRDIQHNANSDMEGRPSDEHYKPKFMDKFVNNSFVSFVFAPLATFDQMLRLMGNKSANGEGYLYNRFMRGWVDARQKEIKGVREKYATLDTKAGEIFGGKVKTWGDLIRRVGKLPRASVSFWNGGEMQERELTQGNLMYIYMVNKMLDGRMKLRKMGITEEDIANIENFLDPRLVELADWLQNEFLVETRNEYNETHKRMFGASMAAIENYFPLKILANARADKPEDLDHPDLSDGISTATGSIIKRRRNALALDITGADALHVILDHVAQMEHWNAFAEFNRDLNTLRTYKRFRNQVQNMTTIYGSGKELWRKFNDVCQMAAGTYRPPRTKLDEAAVNFAKGVTAAKVSFRLFTALKQFLSMPAYIPEARADYLLADIVNPASAWKWSMEHLPIFNERWKSRMIGDPRLMKSDMDWKMWRSRIMQLAGRAGMSPNAFVDALTVSIGAHSMYKTRLGQYLRDGYAQGEAERRAIQDAEILYNQTQQSSEGAFTSTMQVDRSWLSVLFTVFRNSSMSYQRQLHDSIRNLKRNLTPNQKAKSIAFMKKQMVRDGIDEATAEINAKRKFRRQVFKDILRLGVFGYIMQWVWNLGAYLPYLLFGNDDDENQKMWDDVKTHTSFGWVEGYTGGDVISQAGNMLLSGDGNPAYISKDMPLTSDIMSTLQKFGNGKHTEALNDMINLIVQSGIGVNPQSITDAVLAIMDACGDDPALAHEATICIARILQVPQSQIDKMYFDELGLSGDEVSKYTPAQLAQRYARYKVKRGQVLAPWNWDDEERVGKQIDRANRTIKERTAQMGDNKENEAYKQYEEVYKEVDARVKAATKMAKTDYIEAARMMTEAQSDSLAFSTYQIFKQTDSALDRIVKLYITAKSPEEATLCQRTMLNFKAGMVKVLEAQDPSARSAAMQRINEEMQNFSQKYGAMQMQQPNR